MLRDTQTIIQMVSGSFHIVNIPIAQVKETVESAKEELFISIMCIDPKRVKYLAYLRVDLIESIHQNFYDN